MSFKGHEASGTVVQVGKDVKHLKPGELRFYFVTFVNTDEFNKHC